MSHLRVEGIKTDILPLPKKKRRKARFKTINPFDINKKKTLLLGGIAFICNLFNYELIDYEFVHMYYKTMGDIIEGDIENINVYVDTLGSIIDTCGEKLYMYNKDDFYENYIKIIETLSKDKTRLKAKYRFKLLDILNLCKKFNN